MTLHYKRIYLEKISHIAHISKEHKIMPPAWNIHVQNFL
nr:MAG TPA: hypothetical protein [Bacteriophage sp.]